MAPADAWRIGGGVACCIAALTLLLACSNPLEGKFADGQTEKYQGAGVGMDGAFLVTEGGGMRRLSIDPDNPSVFLSDRALTVELNGVDSRTLRMGSQEVVWKGKTYYVEVRPQPKVTVALPESTDSEENVGSLKLERQQELEYRSSTPTWATAAESDHFYMGRGAEGESITFKFKIEGIDRRGFVALERWQSKEGGSDYVAYSPEGTPPDGGQWLKVPESQSPGKTESYWFSLAKTLGTYRLRVFPSDVKQQHPEEALNYYFYTASREDPQSFLAGFTTANGDVFQSARGLEAKGDKLIFVDSAGKPIDDEQLPVLRGKPRDLTFYTRDKDGDSPQVFWGYQVWGSEEITPGEESGVFEPDRNPGDETSNGTSNGIISYKYDFHPQRRNRYALGLTHASRRVAVLAPADFPPQIYKVEVLPDEDKPQALEELKKYSIPRARLDRGWSTIAAMELASNPDVQFACESGICEDPDRQQDSLKPPELTLTARAKTVGEDKYTTRAAFRIHTRDRDDADISFEASPPPNLPTRWHVEDLDNPPQKPDTEGEGVNVYYRAKEGKDEDGSYLDLAVIVTQNILEDDPLSLVVKVNDPLAREGGGDGAQITIILTSRVG